MKPESLIHVRIDYTEALSGKKDILSSQVNLLNTLKSVKKFHILRKKEIQKKISIQKKFKEALASIRKLEKTLPRIPDEEKTEETKEKKIEIKSTNDIDSELQEIQERLKRLGG